MSDATRKQLGLGYQVEQCEGRADCWVEIGPQRGRGIKRHTPQSHHPTRADAERANRQRFLADTRAWQSISGQPVQSRLWLLRRLRGWTQAKLAKRAGVSAKVVWLCEHWHTPTLPIQRKLLRALSVPWPQRDDVFPREVK